MAWAISLILKEKELVETRFMQILGYLSSSGKFSTCTLTYIDATGNEGNQLSQELLAKGSAIKVSLNDMIGCANENGQIFELNLLFGAPWQLRLVVRRGSDFDIVGLGDRLPLDVTGEFLDLDTKLYNF